MKKIFIGLLIVAAGAGAYYLLSQSKNIEPVKENNTTLLLGKWKAGEPAGVNDSSLLDGTQYEVLKDGLVLMRDSTGAAPDSVYYVWTATGDLQIRTKSTDSTGENLKVVQLTKDSLQLKDKNEKLHPFIRM